MSASEEPPARAASAVRQVLTDRATIWEVVGAATITGALGAPAGCSPSGRWLLAMTFTLETLTGGGVRVGVTRRRAGREARDMGLPRPGKGGGVRLEGRE